MLVKEITVRETDELLVKRVTYTRDNSKSKMGKTDSVIREVAYILRHTLHPIVEIVIRRGTDIEYTQEVAVKKAVKQDALGQASVQHTQGKDGSGNSAVNSTRPA